MKRFNKIIMKDEVVSGEGLVNENSQGIVIEAIDHSVKKYFSKAMYDKKFLGGMQFSGENLNASYGIKFMITRIDNNTITLKRV